MDLQAIYTLEIKANTEEQFQEVWNFLDEDGYLITKVGIDGGGVGEVPFENHENYMKELSSKFPSVTFELDINLNNGIISKYTEFYKNGRMLGT